MALSTAKQTSVERFMEGLSSVPDKWRKVVDFRNADTYSLKIAALHGIGEPVEWNGSDGLNAANSAAIDSTGALTLQYTGFATQVQLGRFDILDIPEIVPLAAQKLGQAVAEKYRKLAFNELAGFGSNTTADGVTLGSTSHTLAAGGTRDNQVNAALSRANLMIAIKKMRQFPNYQGQYTSFADGPLLLVVPPSLEQTAIEIVHSGFNRGGGENSNTEVGMQVNAVSLFNIEIIVDPYMASDADGAGDDWALMTADTSNSPIKLWERSAPNFTLGEIDTDTRELLMTVDFAVGVGTGPQPDGFVGGEV